VPVIVTLAILVSPTFEAVYGPSRRARDGAPIVIPKQPVLEGCSAT